MIFEEVNWIRSNVDRLCPTLRKQALEWYRPLRFLPCFLQKYIKSIRRRYRKVPIIVQMEATHEFKSSVDTLAKVSRTKIKSELPLINSFSTKVNALRLQKLIEDESIKKIWYDGTVRAILDIASPAVKATAVWDRNVTGKNIGVAIIDTGIYPHAALTDRIVEFKDFIKSKDQPYDDNGHGTHVAGDIASDGGKSNIYKGSAPDANVIGVKVLDKYGSGSLSTVIEGIQWCIENKDNLGIRIINLSLGGTAQQSYKDDPVCQAVEKAWNSGIVVCIAAGNEGPQLRSIASPGIDPLAITVGAIDDKNVLDFQDYEIASFSSRGPTLDDIIKPDVLCNGTNIISLLAPNSTLYKQNKSVAIENDYISLSGTSMSTPICAGIVALMLEADNTLSPDEIKKVLIDTSRRLNNVSVDIQGNGLIDADECIKKVLSTQTS